MKVISPIAYPALSGRYKTAGFTLIELVVTMALTVIISLGIVIHYQSQTRAYRVQRELAHMQQNLRAAMYMMQNDIRNTGRDPQRSGRYGIQSVVRDNIDADAPNGYPTLSMMRLTDTDLNGSADEGSAAEETIVYQVRDADGDGRRELQRCVNGACVQIVDGIEDIGIAYACDDGSGDLIRAGAGPAGSNPNAEVWAVDTDDSNTLDANADANLDGNIDATDGAPVALTSNIPLNRIRVVRIWLLARSRQAYPDYTDNHTYVVGNRVLDMTTAANANRRNFRHLLLTSAVALQNYELDTNL